VNGRRTFAYTIIFFSSPRFLFAMSETHRIGFVKLNDSNYVEWSIRMEAELVRASLWSMIEVVLDTVDGKDATTIAAELAAKRGKRSPEKMAQARAEMILRVEDGQLSHMRDRDPMVNWERLRSVHMAYGFATSLALHRCFLTAKKRDDEPMQAWIGSIRRQAFLMLESGVATTSQDVILAATMGLPPSYDAVIINFDSTPPDQLTFENVVARLINEETRQQSVSEDPTAIKAESEDVALAAANRRVGRDVICHFCEKSGHVRASCRERQRWEDWKQGATASIAHSASAQDSEWGGTDFSF
jgi:hypothetical protein